jgi:hypothetical protein
VTKSSIRRACPISVAHLASCDSIALVTGGSVGVNRGEARHHVAPQPDGERGPSAHHGLENHQIGGRPQRHYAGTPSPSQRRPHTARIPRAVASRATSSARHALPIPGSPEIRNKRPRPSGVSHFHSREPNSVSSSRTTTRRRPLEDAKQDCKLESLYLRPVGRCVRGIPPFRRSEHSQD